MKSSFIAYIDESGDEGFKFLPDECGSSRWFVVSAAVFRRSNEPQAARVLKETRALLKREPGYALHFKEMKHEQRLAYVSNIATAHFRHVSVMVHKPSLLEPERYQVEKDLLYRYCSRLMLERVSWLCRDHRRPNEGDGTVDLIFSDRSAMSYADLRNYLCHLRDNNFAGNDVRIDWSVIKPETAQAIQHSQRAGLQIADAVASSLFQAANKSRYGTTEPHYMRLMSGQMYRHKQTHQGYGLKMWPALNALEKEMPHLAAFREI